MTRAGGLVGAVGLLLGTAGCPGWTAEGGSAEISLEGDLPWTTAPRIDVVVEAEGGNEADHQVVCGRYPDGHYSVAAFTAELEDLRRVRVEVTIPHFAGTSSYGTEIDPSEAFGSLTLRDGGEDSWASDGDGFPCIGWVDLDNVQGEFTCTGITGRQRDQQSSDGPIDVTLAYRCGPGTT